MMKLKVAGRARVDRAPHEAASVDRLTAVIEGTDGPACVVNARGSIVAANAAFEDLLGLEANGHSGRLLGSLADGSAGKPFHREALRALFSDGRERHRVAGRCVRPDTGETVWGDWDFSLIRDRRGRAELAVAYVTDDTDARRADRHVRILEYLISTASRAEDANALLRDTVQVICHFTGCGLGQVWTPQDEVLTCHPTTFSQQAGAERLRRASLGYRYQRGEGVPGRAWVSEGAVVERVQSEEGFDREFAASRAGAHTVIAVPVRTSTGVAVVLELFVTTDRADSTRQDLVEKVASELGELLERRALHDQIRLSEERFRSVANSAVDAIMSADAEGRILTWNQGAEQMFGWRADEVVGQPLTVIVPERFRAAHRQGVERVATTGHSTLAGQVIELAAIRKDGGEMPIELSIGTWESAEGRFFSGVIRDVTERRRSEDALRVSEERFRSVADSGVDAIVSADTDGRVLTWNRGAEQMFGWRAEEVLGELLTVIIPERFRAAHLQGIERVARSGHSTLAGQVVELAGLRKDGSKFPIELAIGTWESAAGRSFSGVIRDITERKRAEEALAQAAREVERTNSELETLIYAASHDLKSPMISVLGYLDYLKVDYGDVLGDEGGRYLERMTDCTLYMQRLIHDLIKLSRVGRIDEAPVDVDLEDLVATIVDEITPAHPDARFYASRLPFLLGDPVAFRQLMTNLLENAAQHGGRPDLTVVVTATALEGGGVELSVRDNGRGIPVEYRELVFGVFERLDTASDAGRAGTGMGLAICRKIVEQVGGTIAIVGSGGTDVRITLPPECTGRWRPEPAFEPGQPAMANGADVWDG
ncbi:MAG: PAS domain S-box protein [Acidimicrobiia bacterium]|nr:PAS domain S-box protein [Acidimicrobiia bacterium]